MKMTRIIMSLFAVLFLSVSLNAFAESDLSSLKSNKQTSNSVSTRSHDYYRTDVYVSNISSDIVTVKVPGTAMYDTLFPGEVEHFHSYRYFDAVEVVLYDCYGYLFYHGYVPNHATLEVNDGFWLRNAPNSGDAPKSKLRATIKS